MTTFHSVTFIARSPCSLQYLGAYPLPTKRPRYLLDAELFSPGGRSGSFAYVYLPLKLSIPDLHSPTPEPVMFGRDLTEQVRADSKISDRMVPLIVETCIAAVDASGKSPPA